METSEARALAEKMMADHGLIGKGWTFAFDGAERRMGVCRYDYRRIQMSRHYVGAATREQVEQTMLHEIAHALLPAKVNGYTVGHGPLWKEKAASIGYTGKRTASNPYVAKRREELGALSAMREQSPRPAVRSRFVRPTAVQGDVVTIIAGQQWIRGKKAEVLSVGRSRYG